MNTEYRSVLLGHFIAFANIAGLTQFAHAS